MTINEMLSVIDDLKPQFIEEYGLVDLRCEIQATEKDTTFYKCLTVIATEQGMFAAPIFIRIDISEAFVKKALETHIKHLLLIARKGADDGSKATDD